MSSNRPSDREEGEPSSLFAVAFDASPAASSITSLADDTFIDVNRAFLELTGYSRTQVIGRTSAELRLWGERTERGSISQRLRMGEIVRDVEGQMRRRDGVLRDIVASFALVKLASQNAVLSVFYDISDRKQQERYQRLLSTMSVTLRDLENPEAIAAAAVKHIQRTSGMEGIALLLHQPTRQPPLLEESAGPAGDVALDQTRAMFQKGYAPGTEQPNGGHFWGLPLPLEPPLAGALGAYQGQAPGVATDHFMLRAAADALAAALQRAYLLQRLRQQTGRVQRIMEILPAAVLLLDEKQNVIMRNSRAQHYLTLLSDAKPDEPLTRLGDVPIARLLRSPGGTHELHADKGYIFTAVIQNLETDSDEQLLVIRDVTEERRKETQSKEQERLTAVGKLAAGMAHEMNNSLTAIALNIQLLLQKEQILPAAQRHLRQIEQSTEYAATLMQQVLDFGRRAILNRRLLHLAQLLPEWEPSLRAALTAGVQLEIEVAPDSGDARVKADASRLRHVLHNLVQNAVEAMPTGGTIRLRLTRQTFAEAEAAPFPGMQPGSWAVLEVADTGSGIAPEDLPHIFEPFFTTKGAHSARGMGLAQAYGIVKQHEGFVELASQVDEGTTVTIYLPLVQQTDRQEPASRQHAKEKYTVLLVEDGEATRKAVADTLALLDYDVMQAGSARQALELYRHHGDQIGLVLTDLVMPGALDGTDLCRILSKEDPAVRLIAMTGHPLTTNYQFDDLGIVAWLQKPFGIDELADTLKRALKAEP